jgi:EmrB/QacA subfamily drug resistance transporter
MHATDNRAYRLRWWILGTLLIGTVTGTLGNSLVSVALPEIMEHFSVDVGTGVWAVTIYILLFAVTMPLFGRLGDMYGFRRTYMLGIILFAVSSFLTAFSPNFATLIGLRAIQGLGNGAILPTIMAIVGTVFPSGERGRAMGAWALVNSASHAAGPPLSGFLTQHFGWPSVFLSYVPLCLLGALLVWRLVPDDSKSTRRPFDFIGAATLMFAALILMFNLRQGSYLGWTSPTSLALWALALLLIAVFLLAEKKAPEPFVDLGLFSNRPFSAAATVSFVQLFCQFGLLFLIPLFLVEIRDYSASSTGLLLTSLPLAMAIVAPLAGRLADRYGCRLLCLAGMAIVAGSGLALTLWQATTPAWYIVGSLALAGVGMGMVQSPAPATISLVVETDKLGLAMGLFNLVRFGGGTIGPAVFAIVLQVQGPALTPAAFHTVFFLVSIMATLAILAGIAIPGTHLLQAPTPQP